MSNLEKLIATDYGPLDRLLHTVLLGNPFLLKLLSSMEDDLYASKLKGVTVAKPVFVTGYVKHDPAIFEDTGVPEIFLYISR